MESDFPSNSKAGPGARPVKAKAEEKKVERITTGTVVQRKKSLGTRFKETFISGADSKSVLEYVMFDILVPAAKDMVVDATQAGLERKFYGETRSMGRRGYNHGRSAGYTNYHRMGGNPIVDPRARREDPRPGPSRRSRATHDFGEIVLGSRVEANEVIDNLFELVNKYDQATVADLYEMVGITSDFTDNRWGWTNLTNSSVTSVRGGYLLNLPRPEPID